MERLATACYRILIHAVLCAALVLVSLPLCAQSTNGVILGTVRDPSGSPVPSAQVTLVNVATGLQRQTVSNATGDYVFAQVSAGAYALKVAAQGFKSATITNLQLLVGETIRTDVELQIGEVTSTVEVQATIPVVQSETSSVGKVVDSHRVELMPLNGRGNIFSLLALAPGVQNAGTNPLISGGTWIGSTNFTVDGIANNDPSNERISSAVPSLDSVAEFRVIANVAPAEHGMGGAQVIMVTKSGTNQLHGSLFAFNRNRVAAAKDFFATGNPKPPFNRNEFGGSAGGPIIRNKMFFFGSFEGLRRHSPTTNFVAVPTAALRNGDFKGVATIKDPYASGAPFADNRIPANRISDVAKEVMRFYPLPNRPGVGTAGLVINYLVALRTLEQNDRYSGRVDYQPTARDNFSARLFWVKNGPYISASGGVPDTYGSYGRFGNPTRNFMFSYIRTISPRSINEFRAGHNFEEAFRSPQNPDYDPSKFIPGLISPVPGLGGLPNVTITGFTALRDQAGSGDQKRIYQFFDNYTWTNGTHTLKAGFQYMRTSVYAYSVVTRGDFTFNGRYSGHAFADFLMGYMSASGRASANRLSEPFDDRYAGFFQDDWKLSSRLTLNAGLRYEYMTPRWNHLDQMANFYPSLNKIVVFMGKGSQRLWDTLPIVHAKDVGMDKSNWIRRDRNNFGPRIGFAYRPLGTALLVVRSGYGIYYNMNSAGPPATLMSTLPPFLVSETFEPAAGSIPSLTWLNPFPGAGTIPSNPNAPTLAWDFVNPYHQQWNMTLEYEVLRNTAVRASYVGNRGTHLPVAFQLNVPPPAPGPIQPRRPFQPWGNIGYQESTRNSIMHQMQLSAQRRRAAGVAFEIEYQFSRALGGQVYGEAVMDNRNARLDRGNLDYIRRHFTKINYIYDLPLGKGRRFLSSLPSFADKILGGWQLAGIISLATGQPYSVTFTSTLQGMPSSRADIIGNPNLPNPTIQRWFNPAAFAVPAPYTYGNSARNLLFGPNLRLWDAAVFKDMTITERLRLQFRSEFFNMPNHPNFGLPAADITVASTVGRISSTAESPRQIQFGMKLLF